MNFNLPEGSKEVGGTLGGIATLLTPILMDKVPPDDIWKVLAIGGGLIAAFIISRAAFKPSRGR